MNNNEWIVIPNVSIAGLEFGTDRSTVRKALGKPKKVFRKTFTSANTTDAYNGFHVYYTAGDQLEAIEFFDKSISLLINSHLVFPGTLETAKKTLTDLKECSGSFTSQASSVGISVEDGDIISILIGCRGYFNKQW